MANKVIFITSGTTYTVPSDWNSFNNTVECIGAGGGGSAGKSGTHYGSGGGGGEYAGSTGVVLTPGSTINISIDSTGGTGTGDATGGTGGDTVVNGTSIASCSVGAKGGSGGNVGVPVTGGAGGTGGVGTTLINGGHGAPVSTTSTSGGGGGAAGAGGQGGGGGTGGTNASTGGGGGGGGDGSTGGSTSTGTGAAGGAGGHGGGSGGAGGNTSNNGHNGNPGVFYTATAGGTAGPGGGGGGSAGSTSSTGYNGGNGGNYGGGGGGGAGATTVITTGGTGGPGLIVLTYSPSTISFDAVSNSGYQSLASSLSWSHTWSGSNRFLAIDIEILSVNDTVTACTYGGAACTLIGVQNVTGGTGRVECWGITSSDPSAPATGANTISVTLSGSVACAGTAVSYDGVAQPIVNATEAFNGNSGIATGTTATVTVTTISANDWVHAALATNTASGVAASQYQRNVVSGTLGTGADSDYGPLAAGAQVMTFTGIGSTAAWTVGGYGIIPQSAAIFNKIVMVNQSVQNASTF